MLVPITRLFALEEIGSKGTRGWVTYPESASMIQYLINRFGFGKVMGAFRELKSGAPEQQNAATFERLFGASLDTFERDWLTSLEKENGRVPQNLVEDIQKKIAEDENPFPPTTANLKSGLKSYRDGCSGCRGDAGKPSLWSTTDFYPRVPQFDSNPPTKPDWQMFWIVKHGVRYTGMGAWEGLTSDDNIWKAVGFLSHLKDLPPEVAAEWRGQQPSK